MSRVFLTLLATACILSACTTYKLWTESDADRDAGTVSLSYEYRKFESPQVDERAGIQMARERCRDWGFADARRKAEERSCVDGGQADCGKWRVTRVYACAEKA